MAPVPPKHYQLQFSSASLQSGVVAVAQQITQWGVQVAAENATRPLLAICVLRGGLYFSADLLRTVGCSVQLCCCSVKSYSREANQQQGSLLLEFPGDAPSFSGRSVLLIDDMCDTGATLRAMQESLLHKGASDVRSAVLIRRAVAESHHVPDWAVAEYQGDDWLVGYGLDDKDHFSNLPDIYSIPRGV